MSKTISYKGNLPMGEEDRIKLSTINGKTGYKITKFQILSATPGVSNVEMIGKITKVPDLNIGPEVNFTNGDLLAVATYFGDQSTKVLNDFIIFDNEKFNQDIFVNITDAGGNTVPCNYYIELETMKLSELETTMLTLKNIRTVASQ
tara:strand:- start:44 stop:484 length:441 start_codon:yes stop_codon:yes gene_type:complete